MGDWGECQDRLLRISRYSYLKTDLVSHNVLFVSNPDLHPTSSPCSHWSHPQRNLPSSLLAWSQPSVFLPFGLRTQHCSGKPGWRAPSVWDLIAREFRLWPLLNFPNALVSQTAFRKPGSRPVTGLPTVLTISILIASLTGLSSPQRKHILTLQPRDFMGLEILSSFPKGILWYSILLLFPNRVSKRM